MIVQKIKVRGQTEMAFVFVLRLDGKSCGWRNAPSMITAFIINLFQTPVVMQRCGCEPEVEMLPHLMSH